MIALIQFRCLFLSVCEHNNNNKIAYNQFPHFQLLSKLRGIKRGRSDLAISYMDEKRVCRLR